MYKPPTGTAGSMLYCVAGGRVATARNGRARAAPNIAWAILAHIYFLESDRLSQRSPDSVSQRQKISPPVSLPGVKQSRRQTILILYERSFVVWPPIFVAASHGIPAFAQKTVII